MIAAGEELAVDRARPPHLAEARIHVQKGPPRNGGQDLRISEEAHCVDEQLGLPAAFQDFGPREANTSSGVADFLLIGETESQTLIDDIDGASLRSSDARPEDNLFGHEDFRTRGAFGISLWSPIPGTGP